MTFVTSIGELFFWQWTGSFGNLFSMRKLFFILFLLFVLMAGIGGVLFFAKDFIARVAFETAVSHLTGFECRVGSFKLDLARGIFDVEDFVILDPGRFEERIFADIPQIFLEIDLPLLLKKEKIHLSRLKLNIRELNIEKDRDGISNIALLKSVASSPKAAEPSPHPEKPGLPFYLDRLELTLRKVSYNDRSSLIQKKFSLDLRIRGEVFKGIRDAQSIIDLVLAKVFSIAQFENLGVVPAEMQKRFQDTMKTTLDLGGKLLTTTTNSLTERAGGAKEEITGLFGKLKSKLSVSESESSN